MNTDHVFDLEVSNDSFELDIIEDPFESFTIDYSVDITQISGDHYDGPYEITPKTTEQKLETKFKVMDNDVTVLQVPYWKTGNEYGDTVYIASEV